MMENFYEQEELFLCLESHFQNHASVIEQSLLKNEDAWRLRVACSKFASYLSQMFLETMLSEISLLHDSNWNKTVFLKNVAPYLSERLLQKALFIVRNMDRRYSHLSLEILIDLLPHLSDTLLNDALERALEIWEIANEALEISRQKDVYIPTGTYSRNFCNVTPDDG